MLRLFVIFTVFVVGQALTPSSFLNTLDKARLKGLFEANLADEASVSYAVLGLTLLGEPVPNANGLCKTLQANVDKASVTSEAIFAATGAAKALGSCSLKLSDQATKVVANSAGSVSSVQDLYYGVLSQQNLGQKVSGSAVLKNLQEALKKDDGVASLGLAFNLASATLSKTEASAIFDRVEDAIVQADEINGSILQFEGGLSASSAVVTGAYSLAKTVGKAPPMSKLVAVKLANYFLSRKSVQTVKGAWSLLSALTTMATNQYHIPVAITLASPPAVSDASPSVKVQVTNVMGGDLGPMTVQIDSAMRQDDGAVIMSKSKMKALEASLYEIDLMAVKPGKGFYELTLTAQPSKANDRLAGNEAAMLLVKVLGSIDVGKVDIGVADADQSTAPKLTPVAHPNKLEKPLTADHHHKVILRFAVKDRASGAKVKVHQAFVKLALGDDAEIIYVAEPDSSNNYKFDLDVSSKAKEFGGKSGKYSLSLIVGDAVVSNPLNWHIADIDLQFPAVESGKGSAQESPNKPKPEIRHMFREPEKRPSALVSTAFTGLCLVPFAIMLIAWLRLGVNVSAFPFSLSSLGFHAGMGSIFALYVYFWLQLDMFTTIKYLFMAGIVTFLCGNSLLVKIADRRKK